MVKSVEGQLSLNSNDACIREYDLTGGANNAYFTLFSQVTNLGHISQVLY